MANYGRSTYVSWNAGSILELLDFSGFSASTESLETTQYGSAYRSFVPGMTDYGSITVTLATDNIQEYLKLRRSYLDRVTSDLNIITPIGFEYVFRGFITDFSHALDKNGIYTVQLSFKLSGKPHTELYHAFTILPKTGSNLMRGGTYGLFLTIAGCGGEGAIWELTSAHMPTTKIIGNTLVIDAEEPAISVNVTAQWYEESGQRGEKQTATYTLTYPPPTSMSINEFTKEFTFVKDAGGTKETSFTWTVYPSGAQKKAAVTFYDENNNDITTTGIFETAEEGGTLKLYCEKYQSKYDKVGETHRFTVKVTLNGYTGVTDSQEFTVKMTGN